MTDLIPTSVLPNMDPEHAGKGAFILTYSDGTFEFADTPPMLAPSQPVVAVEPDVLALAKSDAKTRVIAWIEQMLGQFTAGYPKHEVQAWPSKLAAARLFIADGTEAAILTIEAQLTGKAVADLVAGIVAKGTLFENISAMASGMRQNLFDGIDAVTDAAAIPNLLARAMWDAEQALAGLLRHG